MRFRIYPANKSLCSPVACLVATLFNSTAPDSWDFKEGARFPIGLGTGEHGDVPSHHTGPVGANGEEGFPRAPLASILAT